MTHDEPEIEATRMNQEAFQDVRVAAQMRAPHPARVVEMRKRAFDPFAALAHQAVDQGLIAVIPLITDDLVQSLRIVNVGLRVFDLLGRGRWRSR